MENNKKKIREIPFVKPARVGNFKLWRSKFKMTVTPTEADKERVFKESGGKKKAVSKSYDIEQINVSDLDGCWQIKIPATYSMFGMINQLFAENEDARIATILGNMMFASAIPNGYFHTAITMVANIFSDPTMLTDEKEFEKLKKNTDALIKAFLDWRKMYDEKMKEFEPTEEDDKHEEIALEAAGILNRNGDRQ